MKKVIGQEDFSEFIDKHAKARRAFQKYSIRLSFDKNETSMRQSNEKKVKQPFKYRRATRKEVGNARDYQ
jgi:hypothetical protein